MCGDSTDKATVISIHALAKRATLHHNLTSVDAPISIHALAKRATQGMHFLLFGFAISIHALAKRATIMPTILRTFAVNFNPRPRKEGDAWLYIVRANLNDFNPRPRKEGDLI